MALSPSIPLMNVSSRHLLSNNPRSSYVCCHCQFVSNRQTCFKVARQKMKETRCFLSLAFFLQKSLRLGTSPQSRTPQSRGWPAPR